MLQQVAAGAGVLLSRRLSDLHQHCSSPVPTAEPANKAHPLYMQVAEETRDMAGNTLDALHEQGQRLDRVEGDLYEVGLIGRLPRCQVFLLHIWSGVS